MLKGRNISTEITSDEIRLQLSTIHTVQTNVSLHAACQHTATDLFFSLFKLHPNMYEMDDASGLVLDRSRSASPDAVRSVAHYLSTFLLAHIPHLTLTPRSDGTVVDESLEPKIAKMLQFVTRTAFFQSGELVFAADLIQRLVEVDMASGRPLAEWIVSNNNLGTVLVVSLLLSNKIFRDVPIRSSWWAMAFGIPLGVLNTSEKCFLEHLKYDVSPTDTRVASILQKVLNDCSY